MESKNKALQPVHSIDLTYHTEEREKCVLKAEYVTFKEIYLHEMDRNRKYLFICLDKVTKNKCLHLKNSKHLNLHKERIDS